MAATSGAHFGIEINADGDRPLVSLDGELDMLAAPDLSEAIAQTCGDGASEIVVDLRRLTFMDSSGLHALLLGRRHCRERGCRFVLVGELPDPIRRLFAVAGIDGLFFRWVRNLRVRGWRFCTA
jgi:anti-sigma B factor antagonist